MTTDGPAVLSVIIPCLNAERTLATQLEALANQPCPVPWEVLVCDNGSTDGTLPVAESYAGRLPLRIIDASDRRGAGPARNRGAERALGGWLAFCDADDEVATDWLAAMCGALAEHPFVAGRFEAHRLNSRRTLRSRTVEQQAGLQGSDTGAGLPHAGAGNMGVHRDLFLRVGGFDPSVEWLEDTDFSWRAQRHGAALVYRPDVVIHVRLRSSYRSMWTQGFHYGRAAALLERRYGPAAPPPPEAADGLRPGWGRRLRRGSTWFIDHVAGKLAWRAGWVVGYRTARTAGTDAGPSPAAAPGEC